MKEERCDVPDVFRVLDVDVVVMDPRLWLRVNRGVVVVMLIAIHKA